MVIFVTAIVILVLCNFADFLSKERSVAQLRKHTEYYRSRGANDHFWRYVSERLEVKAERELPSFEQSNPPHAYVYRVKLSLEVEYPRYLILGYSDQHDNFTPELIFSPGSDYDVATLFTGR
jgi:hypothetical protein